MKKLQKTKIAKSLGKIAMVLFVCFLFFQMGKIPVTNALLRDKASAKNNSFTAGTWGDSLGLQSTDGVIEDAIELGILGEESLEHERALEASLENTEPTFETPEVVEDLPATDEASNNSEGDAVEADSEEEDLPEEIEPEIIPIP